jgi:hypothetical protein
MQDDSEIDIGSAVHAGEVLIVSKRSLEANS